MCIRDRYIAGEQMGDNRLLIAFNLMLSMAIQGIESHEYLGDEFVHYLINKFDLKKEMTGQNNDKCGD